MATIEQITRRHPRPPSTVRSPIEEPDYRREPLDSDYIRFKHPQEVAEIEEKVRSELAARDERLRREAEAHLQAQQAAQPVPPEKIWSRDEIENWAFHKYGLRPEEWDASRFAGLRQDDPRGQDIETYAKAAREKKAIRDGQ